MKIVSTAQHKMLTQAAADPSYAKQRGISQDLAREALIEHAKQGAPKLPERAGPPTVSPRGSGGGVGPVFLTSHRG